MRLLRRYDFCNKIRIWKNLRILHEFKMAFQQRFYPRRWKILLFQLDKYSKQKCIDKEHELYGASNYFMLLGGISADIYIS